jgi:hypothetical protein
MGALRWSHSRRRSLPSAGGSPTSPARATHGFRVIVATRAKATDRPPPWSWRRPPRLLMQRLFQHGTATEQLMSRWNGFDIWLLGVRPAFSRRTFDRATAGANTVLSTALTTQRARLNASPLAASGRRPPCVCASPSQLHKEGRRHPRTCAPPRIDEAGPGTFERMPTPPSTIPQRVSPARGSQQPSLQRLRTTPMPPSRRHCQCTMYFLCFDDTVSTVLLVRCGSEVLPGKDRRANTFRRRISKTYRSFRLYFCKTPPSVSPASDRTSSSPNVRPALTFRFGKQVTLPRVTCSVRPPCLHTNANVTAHPIVAPRDTRGQNTTAGWQKYMCCTRVRPHARPQQLRPLLTLRHNSKNSSTPRRTRTPSLFVLLAAALLLLSRCGRSS